MDPFEEAKLRIKEATDLVALIEGYLPLKARGRNLMACCPFHAENTPSFSVSRENQFFHCFGCGKSGDVFTWIQEREGVSFREAMERLAERAGIELDGVFRRSEPRRGPDPYSVLADVAGYFHRQLGEPAGREARAYLVARGLEDAILPWTLGFCPSDGAFGRFARERGMPTDLLEQAGLLQRGRDPFAGRVMFPILDERGRVVAFGGRIVPGSREARGNADYKPPKYRNSPESPWFNKRRVLFGLHHAKKAGERQLLVMEGYTDVIACHLAGFTGAVASLGTAFTADHSRLIERYASDGIVLMFDGDRAGRTAAERGMRELVQSRVPVRMVVMSDAGDDVKDPADLVAARPGEDPELVTERRVRFADIVAGAQPAITVWFRLLRDRRDFTDPVGLEQAARECAELLALVDGDVRRAALRQQMARHLAVPEQALDRMLDRGARRFRPKPEVSDEEVAEREAPLSPRERAEAALLACLLVRPELLTRDYSAGQPFENTRIGELIEMAAEGHALGRTGSSELLAYLFARVAEQAPLRGMLGRVAGGIDRITDPEAMFETLVAERRGRGRKTELREVRLRLGEALARGDRETAEELQKRLLELGRLDRPREPAASTGGGKKGDTGTPSFLRQARAEGTAAEGTVDVD